jgi:hypothetical protein
MAVFGKVSGRLARRDPIDNEFFRMAEAAKIPHHSLVIDRKATSAHRRARARLSLMLNQEAGKRSAHPKRAYSLPINMRGFAKIVTRRIAIR